MLLLVLFMVTTTVILVDVLSFTTFFDIRLSYINVVVVYYYYYMCFFFGITVAVVSP